LGQGIPNLLRYALDVSLSGDARVDLPTLVNKGSHAAFSFRRDSEKADIAYIVRSSTDFRDWSEVLYDSRFNSEPNTDGPFMKIAFPVKERLFISLEIRLLD